MVLEHGFMMTLDNAINHVNKPILNTALLPVFEHVYPNKTNESRLKMVRALAHMHWPVLRTIVLHYLQRTKKPEFAWIRIGDFQQYDGLDFAIMETDKVRILREMRTAKTILAQAIQFELDHFEPNTQDPEKPAANVCDLNLLQSFVQNQLLLQKLDAAFTHMGENVIFLAHTNYTWLEHVFTDPQFGFARMLALGHEMELKGPNGKPKGKFTRINQEEEFIATLNDMTEEQMKDLTILMYTNWNLSNRQTQMSGDCAAHIQQFINSRPWKQRDSKWTKKHPEVQFKPVPLLTVEFAPIHSGVAIQCNTTISTCTNVKFAPLHIDFGLDDEKNFNKFMKAWDDKQDKSRMNLLKAKNRKLGWQSTTGSAGGKSVWTQYQDWEEVVWDRGQMSAADKQYAEKRQEELQQQARESREAYIQRTMVFILDCLKPVHGWTFDEIFLWMKRAFISEQTGLKLSDVGQYNIAQNWLDDKFQNSRFRWIYNLVGDICKLDKYIEPANEHDDDNNIRMLGFHAHGLGTAHSVRSEADHIAHRILNNMTTDNKKNLRYFAFDFSMDPDSDKDNTTREEYGADNVYTTFQFQVQLVLIRLHYIHKTMISPRFSNLQDPTRYMNDGQLWHNKKLLQQANEKHICPWKWKPYEMTSPLQSDSINMLPSNAFYGQIDEVLNTNNTEMFLDDIFPDLETLHSLKESSVNLDRMKKMNDLMEIFTISTSKPRNAVSIVDDFYNRLFYVNAKKQASSEYKTVTANPYEAMNKLNEHNKRQIRYNQNGLLGVVVEVKYTSQIASELEKNADIEWIVDQEKKTLRYIPTSLIIYNLCTETGFSQHYLDIIFRHLFILGSKEIFARMHKKWIAVEEQKKANAKKAKENAEADAKLKAQRDKETLEREANNRLAHQEEMENKKEVEAGKKQSLFTQIPQIIADIQLIFKTVYEQQKAQNLEQYQEFKFDDFWTDFTRNKDWNWIYNAEAEAMEYSLIEFQQLFSDVKMMKHDIQSGETRQDRILQYFELYFKKGVDSDDDDDEGDDDDEVKLSKVPVKSWLEIEMENINIRIYDVTCFLMSALLNRSDKGKSLWQTVIENRQDIQAWNDAMAALGDEEVYFIRFCLTLYKHLSNATQIQQAYKYQRKANQIKTNVNNIHINNSKVPDIEKLKEDKDRCDQLLKGLKEEKETLEADYKKKKETMSKPKTKSDEQTIRTYDNKKTKNEKEIKKFKNEKKLIKEKLEKAKEMEEERIKVVNEVAHLQKQMADFQQRVLYHPATLELREAEAARQEIFIFMGVMSSHENLEDAWTFYCDLFQKHDLFETHLSLKAIQIDNDRMEPTNLECVTIVELYTLSADGRHQRIKMPSTNAESKWRNAELNLVRAKKTKEERNQMLDEWKNANEKMDCWSDVQNYMHSQYNTKMNQIPKIALSLHAQVDGLNRYFLFLN
jgi:hypothetical protein